MYDFNPTNIEDDMWATRCTRRSLLHHPCAVLFGRNRMNNKLPMLGASLLRARLGKMATVPSTEQQFMDGLCAAVGMSGPPSADLVRAMYVGLKAQFAVCVHGALVAHSLGLLHAFAAAIVGAGSDQIVKVPVPPPDDHVARRFASMRIADVVAHALDDGQHDKAFFVLVHGDDAPALMGWAHGEITSALHAEGGHGDVWPANIVVLGAARAAPPRSLRPWLALRTPANMPVPVAQPTTMPPVGYQRQLIANRLQGASAPWQRPTDMLPQLGGSLPPALTWRWLAASVDAHGCGLWVPDDGHRNAEHALAVLHALGTPARALEHRHG
jgi:hypothetical protein